MSIKVIAVIRKDKINKDGTAPIHIRITQNKRKKYFSTGIAIPLNAWDSENQRISPDYPSSSTLQVRINEKRLALEKLIARMEFIEETVSIDSISLDKPKLHDCRLGEYFEQRISELESMGKIGTASKYKGCLSLLKKCNTVNIGFDSINHEYLKKFIQHLVAKGNKDNSIATKLSVFKAVYYSAMKEGLFESKHNPFETMQVGKYWKQTKKRAVEKEDIQRICNLDIPTSKAVHSVSFARDIFMFSYLTAGMNFKDIAMLKWENVQGNRIYYKRNKTGKEMSCSIMPEVRYIMEKYSSSDENYIFPILNINVHKTEQQIYNRVHKVLGQVNHNLSVIGELLGLQVSLTTYVARHSYATVMKRSGVNIALISETLGHSDLKTTQIYLDSFDNEQINEAMKNLL